MSEIRTGLHVGLKQETMEQRIDVNERYSKVNQELEDTVASMAKIMRVRQQSGELSEPLQKHLVELKRRKDEIYTRCMEIKKEAKPWNPWFLQPERRKPCGRQYISWRSHQH